MSTISQQSLSQKRLASPLANISLNTPIHHQASASSFCKLNQQSNYQKRRFTTQLQFKQIGTKSSRGPLQFKQNLAPHQTTKLRFNITRNRKTSINNMNKQNNINEYQQKNSAIQAINQNLLTQSIQQISIQPFSLQQLCRADASLSSSMNFSTHNPVEQSQQSDLFASCDTSLYFENGNTQLQSVNESQLLQSNDMTQLNVENFEKLKELGKGKFGVVWLVRHKQTNFVCALKQISKKVVRQQKIEHQIAKQIRIHNALKHQNIIDFYGFFNDKQHFYILTEYATSGVVYNLLKANIRVGQAQASRIVRDTSEGLYAMHSQGYIHRDIKPQNLIMQFDTVKLCDLGWATECQSDQLRKSICGTPLYYSPEAVKRVPHNQALDVWTLGLLTYQLLVGRVPFRIWSEFDLPVILQQEVKFPDYVDMQGTTKEFISNCLNKDLNQRPNIQQALESTFLSVKEKPQDSFPQQFQTILQ